MKLLCLGAITALLVQAQPAAVPKPGRLEGKVVSATGKPVAGAEVRLTLIRAAGFGVTPKYKVASDDRGNFVFESVDPADRLALTAVKPGYSTASYGATTSNGIAGTIALKEGETLKDLVLTLTPQSVIAGRVVDGAGDPVPHVHVYLLHRVYNYGEWQFANANPAALLIPKEVETDDRGVFRFAGLVSGHYYLLARPEETPAGNTVPLPTFYPAAAEPEGAKALEIEDATAIENLDFRLREGRVYAVHGKLAEVPTGAAILEVLTEVAAKGTVPAAVSLPLVGVIAKDGSFTIARIPPGSYVFRAIGQAGAGTRTLGAANIRVDRNIDDVVLLPPVLLDIPGKVTFEGGTMEDLAAAAASLPPLGAGRGGGAGRGAAKGATGAAGIRISLSPTGGGSRASGGQAAIRADGTFSLAGIEPGHYYLNRPNIPNVYLKAVRWGNTDLTHAPLDIQEAGSLDLIFAKGAVRITGTAQDGNGKPAGGSSVVLWPAETQPAYQYEGARTVNAGADGSFALPAVAPGTYYAAALQGIPGGQAMQRALLDQLTGLATKIVIEPDKPITVAPPVIPEDKVQEALSKL